ncbi:MAG: hypothetical protein ACOH2K_17125 [Burkholderiaceae bacterium]
MLGPFYYYEEAINELTNVALNLFAKIPEFNYCAIRIALGGAVSRQGSYGAGQKLEKITGQRI